MNRFLLFVSSLFVLLYLFTVCQAETPDIMTFGIVPYFSSAKLMELHKPLKEHLANSLNVTVSLVSAPDFKDAVRDGVFDTKILLKLSGEKIGEVRFGTSLTSHLKSKKRHFRKCGGASCLTPVPDR